jgi:hypothetical protein
MRILIYPITYDPTRGSDGKIILSRIHGYICSYPEKFTDPFSGCLTSECPNYGDGGIQA